MDQNQIKEKLKYFFFGEIKFKNRWKILMWLLQIIPAFILLYYVVIADDFKQGLACAGLEPKFVDGLRSGEYYLCKEPNNKLNITNFTTPNPYPTPNFNYSK